MAEGQDKATRQEQGKEDNSEVYVNRLIQYQLPQAITRKLLRKETSKDETLQMLLEDIRLGKFRPALHRHQQVFEELTIVDGLVVWEEQLIIPLALQGEAIQLTHEGHLGQDKILQWMRQSVWFPNMGAKVREFVVKKRTVFWGIDGDGSRVGLVRSLLHSYQYQIGVH